MTGFFVGYKVMIGPWSKNNHNFPSPAPNASKPETSHASLIWLNGILSLYQMNLEGKYGYFMMIQWCRRRFSVGIAVQVSIWHKKGIPLLPNFPKRTLTLGSIWSITWGVDILWSNSVEKYLRWTWRGVGIYWMFYWHCNYCMWFVRGFGEDNIFEKLPLIILDKLSKKGYYTWGYC